MSIDLQSQGGGGLSLSLDILDYTIINKFVACYWRRIEKKGPQMFLNVAASITRRG